MIMQYFFRSNKPASKSIDPIDQLIQKLFYIDGLNNDSAQLISRFYDFKLLLLELVQRFSFQKLNC